MLVPPEWTTLSVWGYAVALILVSFLFVAKKRPAGLTMEQQAYVAMHRKRLVEFYQVHAPEKIPDVDKTLEKYRGHESTMWDRLNKKYTPTKKYTSDAYAAYDDDEDTDEAMPPAPPPPTTTTTTTNRSTAVEQGRDDFRRAMDERINARLQKH